MQSDEVSRLREEFEICRTHFNKMNNGGAVPGSFNWLQAQAAYHNARDAYQLALQQLSFEIDSKKLSELKIDPLLNIPNRGQFNEDMTQFLERADGNTPLAFIMIDLDGFKPLNDTFGHPVGDVVLRKVASSISSICASRARCYRYGGDEIAVLLPNFSLSEASSFAERIQSDVRALSFENGPDEVTVSIGVAAFPETTQNVQELVQDADHAMYESKRQSKNGVRLAGSSNTPIQTKIETLSNAQIRQRVAAVELWLSIKRGIFDNFLVEIRNDSQEVVEVTQIRLESKGIRLTSPAKPVSAGIWVLYPHAEYPIGWRAEPDPATALIRMNENEGLHFREEIEIVLLSVILGQQREFRQRKIVKVSVPNPEIKELAG